MAQRQERVWPSPGRAQEVQATEARETSPRKPSVLDRIKSIMPRIDEQTGPRATGIFIPSWFLAIALIPACLGILWLNTTLTEIRTNQASLQNSIEFRLKQAEVQEKLNDEHLRLLEQEIAAIKAARDVQPRR